MSQIEVSKLIKDLFIEHPGVEYITVDASGRVLGWLLKEDKPTRGPSYDQTWYSPNPRAWYNKNIEAGFRFPTADKDWRDLIYSRADPA